MSGILGTNFSGAHWRSTTDRSEVIARARAARDTLAHRGSDFAGDWYDDRFFVGHAEHAGLDSGVVGRMPLTSADAAVTVTLDGHISNAQELRSALGKRHAFHGNGGSEVVAQAYVQWGLDEMLSRLRGSFALAIYDRSQARLCLARDALGTRPLYYLHEELAGGAVGSLMFASELKALEALAEPDALHVDYTALYDYLTYRYIPAPKTLYREVRKLGAGQCVSVDLTNGHSSFQTYWELPEPDAALYSNEVEFVERAQELLDRALDGAMPGRVGGEPIGIAGVCQRSGAFAQWLNNRAPNVRPLTLVDDGVEPRRVTDTDIEGLELRRWFDEPFADVSFAARHSVLGSLAGDVDCAISDVGAEVVFGTAPRYRRAGGEPTGTLGWFKSKLSQTQNTVDSASTGAIDAFNGYTKALGGLLPADKKSQREAWEIPADYNDYWYFQQHYRADLPRTLRFQRLDVLTLLPEHQLTQLDRQASRHGIEARTPLLDQDLLVWLLCAPAELRAPQFDVQGALLPQLDSSPAMLERIKASLKGAASFLPGARGGSQGDAKSTLAVLRRRFPEFDAR